MTGEDIAGLLGGLLGLILAVVLLYFIWLFPVRRGVRVAKDKGISPHWMWFGLHPLGAWIAFLILRYGVKREPCVACGHPINPRAPFCVVCGHHVGHPLSPQPREVSSEGQQVLTFACPKCGQHLEAENDLSGMTLACPACSTGLTVPAAPPVRSTAPVVPGSRREARRTDQRAVPESGRPRSVTVVAVLQIIGAALGLLGIPFTIANLAGATNMSEAQRLLFSDPIWRSWTTAGIPLGAAVSVVWIFVAIGLLRLRPAARTAAFWLFTYSILMSVVLFCVVIKVFWSGPFPPGVQMRWY